MSWAEVKNLKDKMSDIANSTLHIEGGTDLAGQEVIIKRYDSDYMKATLDSTGSLEVEVTPKSKYRVTSNDADLSKRSQDIEVGTGDLVNVELSYRKYIGKDVLPVDDVPTWLACNPTAGSYKYTTMEQVLNDSACLIALLSNQNSLDYLMRSPVLFGGLVDNQAACLQFSSMTICNNTLRDTPAMIPIATKSPNCASMFPWSLGRATTAINSNECMTADGLKASKTNMGKDNASIVNCLSRAPYVVSNSGITDKWDTWNTIWGGSGSLVMTVPTTDVIRYKFLPKCIIVNAPIAISNYSGGTVTVAGLRADGTWDTLASMEYKAAGARSYVDIADNDKEYIGFSVTTSNGVVYWSNIGSYPAIGNIPMLGYRYLNKDGREPA